MKLKLTLLSQHYVTALRNHLEQGSAASLRPALVLGQQSADRGMETVELARIHKGALARFGLSKNRNQQAQRAKSFFASASSLMEKKRRATLRTNTRLTRAKKALDQRTMDLVAAKRSLKEGVAQQKKIEKVLREKGGRSKKRLDESLQLQKHLQHLTHLLLSAQEDKRTKISRGLQNNIAQTLLGINVRLLTLKKGAAVNAKGFKKEIASTQRLVEESVESIHRFARELDPHPPVKI